MEHQSPENIVKGKVEGFVESVDKNKNKKIEASEKNFDEQVKKQLQELRAIAEGPDTLKREALVKAVIEVTNGYEGLSVDDVFQWMNAVSVAGNVDIVTSAKRIDEQKAKVPYPERRRVKEAIIVPKGTLEAYYALPSGAGQENIVFRALEDIVSGKTVDYKSFSYGQKVLLLLNFGDIAHEGYDYSRKNDIYSGDSIPLKDFLRKMKGRMYLPSLIREAALADGWNGKGEYLIPKNSSVVKPMIESLSKLIGVTESELKKTWDESANSLVFENQINEKYLKAGVCRDIAVFQAKLADDMGLRDTFVTTGNSKGRPHVLGGFRNERGNIVFFNYCDLIETNTPNMKMALVTMERYSGSISLDYLQAKGGDEGGNLVRIKSEASETLREIAKGTPKKQGELIDETFNRGGLEHRIEGATYSVERGKTSVDLNVEKLGGSMIISTMNSQPQREANAIDEAHSLRLAQEYGGKHLVGGLSMSVANISLRADHPGDREQLNKFLVDLYVKTHASVKLTKRIEYQISAMADAIVDVGLKQKVFSTDFELATGQRLSYIAPDLTLYVGMQTAHALVPKKIQAGGMYLKGYTMVNDLLAANVGAKVQLGTFQGHKVHIASQAQLGKAYSGLATEYQGDVKLEAMGENDSLYVKGRGKYTGSDDFRISNEARKEISAGYVKSLVGGKVLEMKGFAFQNTSLGKFKDPRLDDFGMGFQVTYLF